MLPLRWSRTDTKRRTSADICEFMLVRPARRILPRDAQIPSDVHRRRHRRRLRCSNIRRRSLRSLRLTHIKTRMISKTVPNRERAGGSKSSEICSRMPASFREMDRQAGRQTGSRSVRRKSRINSKESDSSCRRLGDDDDDDVPNSLMMIGAATSLDSCALFKSPWSPESLRRALGTVLVNKRSRFHLTGCLDVPRSTSCTTHSPATPSVTDSN